MPRGSAPPLTPAVDLAALSPWAPELAETFAALSSDVALVLDEHGVIVKLAQHPAQPLLAADWVGKEWAETVTAECRGKVQQMLHDVSDRGIARRREINHPQLDGSSAAVAYTAVRLGENGATLAVGRDLRAQAAMQQRFVLAQHELEKAYWDGQQGPASQAQVAAEPLLLVPKSGAAEETQKPSAALLRALDGLQERMAEDALPNVLRDAKRMIERHFLQRALLRTGSEAALARELGISVRTLLRRMGKRSSVGGETAAAT